MKGWLQRFTKCHSLSCHYVHKWATLHTREHGFIYFLGQLFAFAGKNESATRTTKRLVRR